MAQRPRIGANAGWGIGLIGAGVTLLAGAVALVSEPTEEVPVRQGLRACRGTRGRSSVASR